MEKGKDTMTSKQKAIISRNLKAFTHNFGEVRIETIPGYGFNVYYPANSDSFIQFCENIHYLDGWLYGCVQGFLRREFKEGYQYKEDNA